MRFHKRDRAKIEALFHHCSNSHIVVLTLVPHFLMPYYSLESYVCKVIVCQLFFTHWQPHSGLPCIDCSGCPSSHGIPHFGYLIVLSAL